MTTSIESKGLKIEIITTVSNEKIDAIGGAAPWMIGTTVRTSKTLVLVNGEYVMNFPFSHKRHLKGGIAAKNQLDQLISYL
jgi:hypothetical protein